VSYYVFTGNPRCPVASLSLYLSKLHPDNEAFFQRSATKMPDDNSSPWYTKQALGHNTIGKMMLKISEQAHLSKMYTNHCVRATCITLLDRNGFESRHIMGISKHKSESSLKHYSARLCDDKRVKASEILNRACNGSEKENINSVIQGKVLKPVDNQDIQEDPALIDFLSSSQVDQMFAYLDDSSGMQIDTSPNAAYVAPTVATNPLGSVVPANSSGIQGAFMQTTRNDTNLNLVPFNLVNYGTVNINYCK
jgi:hypothetical protein